MAKFLPNTNPDGFPFKYNHVENAEILLRHGANPNGSNIHTESPVHIAVRDGFYDIIEVLLKYGANPNGSDEDKPIKRENFGTIPVSSASKGLRKTFIQVIWHLNIYF